MKRKRREKLFKRWGCQQTYWMKNTSKPCSCWMCGNPRKYFKELTMQERVDKLRLLDEF